MINTSSKNRINVEEIYNQFLGLDSRQRILILVGIGFIFLLFVLLPISCATSALTEKEKKIVNSQKNMGDLRDKLREYQETAARYKAAQAQWMGRSKISPSTILESLALEAGLDKTNLEPIQDLPSVTGDNTEEIIKRVRVSRAPLSPVISYLYKVES